MKYDAFISYRHTPLDMEMAKKVHTGLETYHVPGAVKKKTGKKKIQRVFRDEEELPIGSDLNDNISGALAQSEYLIVICSPHTPDSYWVCKEIETFIKMHDREHVLAVLIEGEPNESFPPILLTDEKGNPVEPLAADVRGIHKSERNKRFKTEILRLAAPVLGCSYDDLRQRHRERMIRKRIISISVAAGIIATAGTAFGIYNANVADKILVQYKEKQKNQSRFFADETFSLLEKGEREAAVLVAKAGLPAKGDDRPYVAEAEYALSSALHAYDIGVDYDYDRVLNHDVTVQTMKLSSDGKYLTSIDSGQNIYVWDTESWKLLLKIEPVIEENNYLRDIIDVNVDSNGVYVATEYTFTGYDFEGNIIYHYDSDELIVGIDVLSEYNVAYCITGKEISIIELSTGKRKSVVKNPVEESFSSKHKVSYDGRFYCVSHYSFYAEHALVSVYDTRTGKLVTATLKAPDIKEFCFTSKGNIAVLTGESDFSAGIKQRNLELINPETGAIIWTNEFEADVRNIMSYSSLMKSHSYTSEAGTKDDIVIAIDSDVYTFDESSGKMYQKTTLPAVASTLNLSSESSGGRIAYRNGNIDIIDFATGRIYSDYMIETNIEIREVLYVDGQIVLRAGYSPQLYVMSGHEASDLALIAASDITQVAGGVSPDADYFITRNANDYSIFYFYDDKGKSLYQFDECDKMPIETGFIGNDFIFAGYNEMWIIDPVKGKSDSVLYSDIGLDEHQSVTNAYFTSDGKYGVLWGSNYIAAVDIESQKCIYSEQTDHHIGGAVISSDGERIYISRTGENLCKIDVKNKKETFYAEDALREISDCYMNQFMAISDDDQYVAMCCMDGIVRIVDTSSEAVISEIPLQTIRRDFLEFTKDGQCIIVQGDDYKIRIWNIAKGEYINSFEIDVETEVKYIVDDGDHIAVCTGFYTYMLETENYGLVASVPYSMTYLSEEDAFICCSNSDIYKTYYKDYKQLIAEADRQFPDSELSEEDKVRYNIK